MKKSEIWEGAILLLSAVLLLPIWMASSQRIELPVGLLRVLNFLQYPLVVVLGVNRFSFVAYDGSSVRYGKIEIDRGPSSIRIISARKARTHERAEYIRRIQSF